jgi:hypothetical protein
MMGKKVSETRLPESFIVCELQINEEDLVYQHEDHVIFIVHGIYLDLYMKTILSVVALVDK